MARTWSNAKRTDDDLSAAQRARNRPSSLTAFVILITLTALFFLGLMTFTLVKALTHPPTEVANPASQEPKDD